MNTINEFRGEYKSLSNFFGGFVVYEGLMYESSEAAFQAAKTLDKDDRMRFMHMTPKQAKAAGQTVKLRSDWEIVKNDVMKTILIDKFTRNLDSRKLLIDTGDAYLEEGNHHGDKVWGRVDGVGENRLGIILMEIREMIKREECFTND